MTAAQFNEYERQAKVIDEHKEWLNSQKKQTAVNWMIEQLIKKHTGNVGSEYIKIFEQAKQMEKEQIQKSYLTCWEDYVNEGKYWEMGENPKETFIDYYNETYGSKGSDETKKVQPQTTEENFGSWLKRNYFTSTSSQTEISDEEIGKFAEEFKDSSRLKSQVACFSEGMKKYREQLKQR